MFNKVSHSALPEYPAVLPERMATKTTSKQTSAAASKIKNKILNTSSFFKVSLKTNNKALALALEAQKERSRQLEKQIVYLQKQVEALCFELASKKYKHRKLLLILKNFHSNTLQHLDMVAELFSDSDLPKLPEKDKTFSDDINKENPAVRSLTDHLPPQPEISGANVLNIKDGPKIIFTDPSSENTNGEERHLNQRTQCPQTGTSRPSSNLRDEVERLSMMFSQPGFDRKSVFCLQNSQTPSSVSTCEKPKPTLSDAAHLPCSSGMETVPERSNTQEKTVLLNTTMEMTLNNSTEIVTVETKAKKTGRSGKPKGKKNKEQVCGSSEAEYPQAKNSAECRLSEVHCGPTDTLLQTDDCATADVRDPEVNELHSPKTQSMSVINSRIPKLNKYEAGNSKKKTVDQFKSHDHTKSHKSCDNVSPDMDDYFMDPEIRFSKASQSVKLLPEKYTAEETRSKITCRRSKSKGRRVSSVSRKTFLTFPLPLRESDSSQSTLEQLHNEVEEERVGRMKAVANSGGINKPRCRETFVISVDSDGTSPNRASLGAGTAEQDFITATGSSICVAEELSTVTDPSVIRQHSESHPHRHTDGPFVEKTQGSCKRPWLDVQDSGNPQDDLSSNDNHEVLLLDQGCTSGTECQKPKKARKQETSKSRKKKAVQREECVDYSNDREKKEESSRSNKELRSENEACFLSDLIEGPERNKEQLDDLQGDDLHSDIFGHSHNSKPKKSEWNPKQCSKTSKLQTPTESRNPRETFVVYKQKTQDSVSLNSTRTSDVSHAYSHMMDTSDEAVDHNLGDLLMDEVPPWLAIDISTADTAAGSFLATPKRDTSHRAAVIEESAAVPTEASSGRVLTSLTNTIATPDSEMGGRTRRRNGVVSYKEPALNSKIRRGDKHTDSTFLSSPVFKDGKKKRQKKTVAKPKLERSILMD